MIDYVDPFVIGGGRGGEEDVGPDESSDFTAITADPVMSEASYDISKREP